MAKQNKLAAIEAGLEALCQDSLDCPLSHVDDPGIRDRGDEISDLFRQVRDDARALAGELADTKKQQDKTEELLCLMTNPAYGRIDVDLDIFEEEEDEI